MYRQKLLTPILGILFVILGLLPIEVATPNIALPPANQTSVEPQTGIATIEYAAACDKLTDPMERQLCQFVTAFYPAGLLTNWPNPHLPGHVDHAPMFEYGENQPAISESASMLALYAALIGDQTTFDYVFDVSAPAEIGGTGAPMSGIRETPYYFASPNLCLPISSLHPQGWLGLTQ